MHEKDREKEKNNRQQHERADAKPAHDDHGRHAQQQAKPDDKNHPAHGKGHGEQGQPAQESAAAKGPTAEEHAALNDRYIRLMADFDNFRKRVNRERADIVQRANEDFLKDLLPILDHMELAMESAKNSEVTGPVIDGFKMVGEQLAATARSFGLDSFASVGKPFDPAVHEAISHLPDDKVPENQIVAEVRKGYMLGGKLFRAARVVISSGKPAEAPSAGQTPGEG
ncbi:MAG: nucleotide exchange factor GrpE [Verrucomicrobia bacterium]|nr:nucleotide exchange factor GrpE [Verrucomicrobiota bacterium]